MKTQERYPGSGIPVKKLTVQPLHVQLRETLIKRISAGLWQPGEVIPNEVDLAREFNLSPGTVRKALDWMEQARLVTRQQGRGTFVTDPACAELATRYEHIYRASGGKIEMRAMRTAYATAEASPAELERLKLKPGERVLRVDQVRRSTDGDVVSVEQVAVPAEVFGSFSAAEGQSWDLVQAAKRCNVLLGGGTEKISIAAATAAVAESLGMSGETPVILLERLVHTVSGRPVEYRKAWCRFGENFYQANLI